MVKKIIGGMQMLLMLLVGSIFFLGVPFLKHLERKAATKNKDEVVFLELKEKTTRLRIASYIVFVGIIIFAIRPVEVDLYLALTKILFILGLYSIENMMRTKFYVTNEKVYYTTRFKKKAFIKVTSFKSNEIFRIDSQNKKGHFKMFYYDEKQNVKNMTVQIEKRYEIESFKKKMKAHMNVTVPELMLEENELKPKKELIKKDKVTKSFVISSMLLFVYGLINVLFVKEFNINPFQQSVAFIIALQSLPFILYYFTYNYINKKKKNEKTHLIPLSKKEHSLVFVIGSSTLPFITIMNHGMVDGTRFLYVQLIGFGLFLFLNLLGKVVGFIARNFKGFKLKKKIKKRVRT